MTKRRKPDPAAALRDALDVLSRADIERAWSAAEAVNQALSGNVAQRTEVAAYLLAQVISEISAKPDDFAELAAAVECLSQHLNTRMTTMVIEAEAARKTAASP